MRFVWPGLGRSGPIGAVPGCGLDLGLGPPLDVGCPLQLIHAGHEVAPEALPHRSDLADDLAGPADHARKLLGADGNEQNQRYQDHLAGTDVQHTE